MSERDPQFTEDVLKIVYAALADREALAAAMSEAQPLPVAGSALAPTDPTPPSRPSPMEVGIQGGSPLQIPGSGPFKCGQVVHINYEDLAYDQLTENRIEQILTQTGATREQVVQEAMRRAIQAQVGELIKEI